MDEVHGVYGSLFGSAESLRALIPLTGELKDKFVENVGQMGDAAGTCNEAFEQMSSTGASQFQMLKNTVLSEKKGGTTPSFRVYPKCIQKRFIDKWAFFK